MNKAKVWMVDANEQLSTSVEDCGHDESGGTRMMKTWMGAVAVAVGVVMVSAPVVRAEDLTIPIDTVISSGFEVGDEVELETVAADALEGATCEVRSVRREEDQIETNSGNDLVVQSGQQMTTLEDVEREPEAETDGTAIELGPTISVTLLMGEDKQFAAGIDIEFDCGLDAVTTQVTAGEDPPADDSDPADAKRARTAAKRAKAAEKRAEAAAPLAPPSTAEADLPVTGSETATGALLGGALVCFGAAMVLVARRPANP